MRERERESGKSKQPNFGRWFECQSRTLYTTHTIQHSVCVCVSQAQHQRPNLNLFKTCKLLGGLIKINAQLGTLGKRDIFLSRATFPFHNSVCLCRVWAVHVINLNDGDGRGCGSELRTESLGTETREKDCENCVCVCVCREYQIKIIFQLCALEFTAETAATKNQSTSIYVCRELFERICMEHNTTHRKE